MREFFRFLFNIYATIMYRPKVVGKENIPAGEGALICPNHIHALDSVLVVAQSKRKIYCLAVSLSCMVFGLLVVNRYI